MEKPSVRKLQAMRISDFRDKSERAGGEAENMCNLQAGEEF